MNPDEVVPSAAPAPFTAASPAGLVLAPFRALRYDTRSGVDLTRVISPPYDVIDEAQRRDLEAADPHNVVRLILPRDEEGHPGSGYARAARTLSSWRHSGVLSTDDEPGLYVYEMVEDGQATRGLIGSLALVRPEANIVLPHENTMAGTVTDRLRLTHATETDLEPIYLVHDGGAASREVLAAQDDRTPTVEATAHDGSNHRLWSVTDPDVLAAVAADLLPRRAVIADGHHRYATYLQAQADRHARGEGPGPWDHGLVLLVDATTYGPKVRPIHRVVTTLPLAAAVERARAGFATQRIEGGERAALDALAAARTGSAGEAWAFVLTDGADWYLLNQPDMSQLAAALPRDRSTSWRQLDVTVAHQFLIQRLWNLNDHEDIVGFEHDVAAAVTAVREGGTALLLNPTPVEDVIAVAAAGERMPRKSTLFTPKPRTGFVLRPYTPDIDHQ